jgi:putative tryptophan/tyrosine transport system substrate-binding protein
MQFGQLKRREFMTLLGGATATWPLAARAQQPAMPVIGWLSSGSQETDSLRLAGLRQGLNEAGYVEGSNLTVEHRWAENQIDRLPALAAQLVQMRVAVIVTPGLVSTLPAKAATSNIPILFALAADPVQIGLVASLNRPGGNATGFNALTSELGAKKIALFHELLPNISSIGFLENPSNQIDELMRTAVLETAAGIGLRIQTLRAATAREIDVAFESLVQARTEALLLSNDAFLNSQHKQIIALAARLAIPVMYGSPEFVVAGGLVSYGTSLTDEYRQLGLYAGRILKGASPAELPVIQASKFTLVINLKTAKSLGLKIPDRLLALVDEVIE